MSLYILLDKESGKGVHIRGTYMGSSGPNPISVLNTPSPTGVNPVVWLLISHPLGTSKDLPGVSGMAKVLSGVRPVAEILL